jgi:competence protein ComEC
MPTRLYKILVILGIAAMIVAILLFWFYYNAPKVLEVDFLNVGQGDAALIKTPYGQNILIDGGPDNTILR